MHMACSGWVESIGVANKNAVFVMLVGLAKPFEAYLRQNFDDLYGFVVFTSAQMPKCPDLAILW